MPASAPAAPSAWARCRPISPSRSNVFSRLVKRFGKAGRKPSRQLRDQHLVNFFAQGVHAFFTRHQLSGPDKLAPALPLGGELRAKQNDSLLRMFQAKLGAQQPATF